MGQARIGIIMGSDSDYETMQHAESVLKTHQIDYEIHVVSAHRTPERMVEYAKNARQRGIEVIIAGAGGAAHLPGMVASMTTLPVLGVPVQSRALNGLDSLLSIVQMPGGVPTATFSIGRSGATNAAIFAMRILGLQDSGIHKQLDALALANQEKAMAGDQRVQPKS